MKAISKHEFLNRVKIDLLEPAIERANTVINNSETLPIRVSMNHLAVPYMATEDFRAHFRAAGWDVSLTHDQRDGSFWTFK